MIKKTVRKLSILALKCNFSGQNSLLEPKIFGFQSKGCFSEAPLESLWIYLEKSRSGAPVVALAVVYLITTLCSKRI